VRVPVLLAIPLFIAACGSQPENATSDQGVTVDLPGAEPANSANALASAEPLPNATEPAPPPSEPATAKPEPVPGKAEPTSPPAEPEPAGASADTAPATADPTASAAGATPAQLPISNAQAARTIDRIGFSCGEVVSTERVLTDGGTVFRINCSSGQSYRGATQRGRLRFRRWADD
jgi:hypothetical protein